AVRTQGRVGLWSCASPGPPRPPPSSAAGAPGSRPGCRPSPEPMTRERGAAARPSSVRQLPVLEAVRLVGLGAQPLVAVCLVILVVPLEPDHLTVPLEGEDVGG